MNPHSKQVLQVLKDCFGDREFTGIEIGTGEAEVTKCLLTLPNLKSLYTMDPYRFIPGTEFEASINDQKWHEDRRHKAIEITNAYPVRCILLRMTSNEAVVFTPEVVDFVWIDGDHGDEQIAVDVENYYPKVRTGGIFGGHDSHRVLSVLDSKNLLTETIHQGEDLTWWVTKK